MTTNQKIEGSREVRQWVKLVLSALGIWAIVDPDGVKRTGKSIKDKACSTLKHK